MLLLECTVKQQNHYHDDDRGGKDIGKFQADARQLRTMFFTLTGVANFHSILRNKWVMFTSAGHVIAGISSARRGFPLHRQ